MTTIVKANKIEWENIYYHEELDTDGGLLNTHWTEEANYRNGYLIRDCYQEGIDGEIKINIVFVQTIF